MKKFNLIDLDTRRGWWDVVGSVLILTFTFIGIISTLEWVSNALYKWIH